MQSHYSASSVPLGGLARFRGDSTGLFVAPSQPCANLARFTMPRLASPARVSTRRSEDALAGAFGERVFTAPHFEAVPAVDCLDVEDLATGQPEHALHRRRHVLVHAIGKLDDDDRALARRSHETPCDCAGPLSQLAQDDFHTLNLAPRRASSSSVSTGFFGESRQRGASEVGACRGLGGARRAWTAEGANERARGGGPYTRTPLARHCIAAPM
jgi:hypothetical protein